MRSNLKYFLAAFTLIALALPAWARTEQITLSVDQPVMVGTTQLQTGEYQVKIEDGKKDLMIFQNGKVVADVQGQWVKLPAKARESEVQYDDNRLIQVQFDGQMEAFHLG